uniref:Heme oxygenase n=1 Tax=Cacopsylla melanoneura TaxID=428564 RepID=A0A8D8RCC5_9HEMI
MDNNSEELPLSNPEILFSKEMRKVTRDVHDLSDALVNAKLVLAMSDTNIWIEGLLVFYEVFKFLELCMEECLGNKRLQQYNLSQMKRTAAFESDLQHYLGADWRGNYKPRQSVVNYLDHLAELKEKNDTLLIAYVYHLYLGVLSGGQLINKKRQLSPFKSSYHDQVLCFPPEANVAELKRQIKAILDEQSSEFNSLTRRQLLGESRRVFHLNNSLIKSIDQKRMTHVLVKKLLYLIVICFLIKKLFDFVLM